MWYEILPSAALVMGCITAPTYINWVISKLSYNGKSCQRNWDAGLYMDYNTYLRDKRITGSEYVPRGLESIPDEKSN
ncbi:NADH dehydrogenase [ubiquinone] 1 alpha subcomplex subunit 1-like [Haliotis cracherodii]|uniref:NADH dehydrogenase [ubiquinone] 1 alpha subcomplex subunit 1-like n=1 Tax=Haliotis cracherodii TaxID=6455 RepID=UPI0039E80D74